jgi:hypothetical protein
MKHDEIRKNAGLDLVSNYRLTVGHKERGSPGVLRPRTVSGSRPNRANIVK